MINSVFPIKDRVYFLKHDEKRRYEEYRYKEHGRSYQLHKTNNTISYKQAKSYLQDTSIIQQFTRELTLPYEQNAWNNAPPNIKQALLFSYVYHKHHKNHKVANVETMRWSTLPFFHRLLTFGKQQSRLRYLFPHVRTWFNAMTMTHGNHKKNLRLGHIHLTEDRLHTTHHSCIHWDIGASRFSPSLLLHWFVDDMSS